MKIDELSGVGIKRNKIYEKMHILTAEELLRRYPRDYLDYTTESSIENAAMHPNPCVIRATITRKLNPSFLRSGITLYKLHAVDDNSTDKCSFEIAIFNNKYAYEALELHHQYLLYGKVETFNQTFQMTSPQIEPADKEIGLLPIYRLTEGLTSRMVMTNVREALEKIPIEESLPENIIKSQNLCSLEFALQNIHFPKDKAALDAARERLVFEELLILQLGLSQMKSRLHVENSLKMQNIPLDEILAGFPYKPTDAQMRAIKEICSDFTGDSPGNRLLQGDVGSGKTLVATVAAFFCIKNGYQCALMAPTEILAAQHYENIFRIFAPLGINTGLLTGSMKASEKRRIKEQIRNGEIDLAIGTHALLTDDVDFANLAFVITDEQHRFGVRQRGKLSQKSENLHTLVMSATPIPRTLALIIYGDLELSILDELPPGRQEISTVKINSSQKMRAYNFILENCKAGRQCYIVCPAVEEGRSGLTAAKKYIETLENTPLAPLRKALIHGKIKQSEKDKIMKSFKNGELDLIVSTTVIEVGVDVPNATIMMIENAERFGLSQLHQLRGRVGRGSQKSYCILSSDNQSESVTERLSLMCSTSDGFKIAEYDLKTRGPGDFFGQRQHGLPEMKIADMSNDIKMLDRSGKASREILAADPTLESAENAPLKNAVKQLFTEEFTEN